jgi:hypothetical protein
MSTEPISAPADRLNPQRTLLAQRKQGIAP